MILAAKSPLLQVFVTLKYSIKSTIIQNPFPIAIFIQKLTDLLISPGLLLAKLIARENDELDLIGRVVDQLLKLSVLAIGHASFGGAVDNDDDVAGVVFLKWV